MNMMRIQDENIVTDDIFQIIIDNFPDIVHSVDVDGNIVFTNKTASTLLGYAREELLNMNIREIYAEEVLQAVEKGFSCLQQRGEKSVESVLKDRYGNRIPVEIRSFSIYDNDGHFIRTFSILRDIRKVKELQQSLIHAERLAAIGELASGIVHDINNPLTVISLCAHVMQKQMESEGQAGDQLVEQLMSDLKDIVRAAGSIEKLVTHLRNFSRRITEPPQVLDLHTALSDARFLVNSKIQKLRVMVKADIREGIHFVCGVSNQVEQVFANLISNACDAMADREERLLTIRIAACTREGQPLWRCDVADTGAGIPREEQGRIFEAFYTTKEKGKGTGLGLSIVRGIVKDHKGDVEVVSQPGKGTLFSVFLPQSPPDTEIPYAEALALGRELSDLS